MVGHKLYLHNYDNRSHTVTKMTKVKGMLLKIGVAS
jgi:hypothetical protein